MRETDRQKDAETEIKSKALKSWAQSSYPSYPEWSLTGYSLTQNMSQVFWPKFHGLSGFLMLNRNLKFIPSWNSIDSRPAWELGTGRHLWIGVTSPYLPILLIWILHLPCPFQLDMFPPYSQIQGDHANLDCLGLPGMRLPQFSDLELAIFDEGLSCIRPFLYSIPKCCFEKLIDKEHTAGEKCLLSSCFIISKWKIRSHSFNEVS